MRAPWRVGPLAWSAPLSRSYLIAPSILVDELVRTLPPMTTRRATVPAAFDLDRAGSKEAPSYLEMWLRKKTATNPSFACADVDGSCICMPGAAKGGTDQLPKID